MTEKQKLARQRNYTKMQLMGMSSRLNQMWLELKSQQTKLIEEGRMCVSANIAISNELTKLVITQAQIESILRSHGTVSMELGINVKTDRHDNKELVGSEHYL